VPRCGAFEFTTAQKSPPRREGALQIFAYAKIKNIALQTYCGVIREGAELGEAE
jgi:hypothetical protein